MKKNTQNEEERNLIWVFTKVVGINFPDLYRKTGAALADATLLIG